MTMEEIITEIVNARCKLAATSCIVVKDSNVLDQMQKLFEDTGRKQKGNSAIKEIFSHEIKYGRHLPAKVWKLFPKGYFVI